MSSDQLADARHVASGQMGHYWVIMPTVASIFMHAERKCAGSSHLCCCRGVRLRSKSSSCLPKTNFMPGTLTLESTLCGMGAASASSRRPMSPFSRLDAYPRLTSIFGWPVTVVSLQVVCLWRAGIRLVVRPPCLRAGLHQSSEKVEECSQVRLSQPKRFDLHLIVWYNRGHVCTERLEAPHGRTAYPAQSLPSSNST